MNGKPNQTLRGVNLGNWFLLEKWMRPSLFDGTRASDEYTLSAALGASAEATLRRHRETFITDADFAWLAERGLNCIRLPFGYWVLEPDGPYIGSPELLDHAVDLAEQHGLQVMLDLHGLPGAQGPNDHAGRAGHFQWHRDPRHIPHSLDIIEHIAQRYADRKHVVGFSVINEPHQDINHDVLVGFYEQAYDRVRRHMAADDVAVVVAAYPEGKLGEYHGCLGDRANVWTDMHLYQCFGEWDHFEVLDYLAYPLSRQVRLLPHMDKGPIIIGEWSLGIAGAIARKVVPTSPEYGRHALSMIARMQLAMYEQFTGWFFWSYLVDNRPSWSFRHATERGWLPDTYGRPTPVAERAPTV